MFNFRASSINLFYCFFQDLWQNFISNVISSILVPDASALDYVPYYRVGRLWDSVHNIFNEPAWCLPRWHSRRAKEWNYNREPFDHLSDYWYGGLSISFICLCPIYWQVLDKSLGIFVKRKVEVVHDLVELDRVSYDL